MQPLQEKPNEGNNAQTSEAYQKNLSGQIAGKAKQY